MSNRYYENLVGIVTRQNKEYVWIWTSEHPLQEIQFFSIDTVLPGDLVACILSNPPNTLQYLSPPIERISEETIQHIVDYPIDRPIHSFRVLSHVAFPPSISGYFHHDVIKCREAGINVYGFGFSTEFGKVLALNKVDALPGEVFLAWISRIPLEMQKDLSSNVIGTLFQLDSDASIIKISNKDEAEKTFYKMPWNRPLVKTDIIVDIQDSANVAKHEKNAYVISNIPSFIDTGPKSDGDIKTFEANNVMSIKNSISRELPSFISSFTSQDDNSSPAETPVKLIIAEPKSDLLSSLPSFLNDMQLENSTETDKTLFGIQTASKPSQTDENEKKKEPPFLCSFPSFLDAGSVLCSNSENEDVFMNNKTLSSGIPSFL